MEEFLELLRNVVPNLLQGTVITLQLAGVSLALGVAIGLPAGIGRVYGPRWLQRAIGVYITVFQGTPLLIQLFLIYYGLPDVGITFSRMAAAYLTLGLNSGAYQAEYLRGALQSDGRRIWRRHCRWCRRWPAPDGCQCPCSAPVVWPPQQTQPW